MMQLVRYIVYERFNVINKIDACIVFSLQYLIIFINLRCMIQNLGIHTDSEVLYVNQQNLFPVNKNQGCFE